MAQVRAAIATRQNFSPTDEKALQMFGRDEFRPVIDAITIGLEVLLTFVGALTLGIGGVGVMNIMLVSVEERIREIGLRRALGAKKSHIKLQFLAEIGLDMTRLPTPAQLVSWAKLCPALSSLGPGPARERQARATATSTACSARSRPRQRKPTPSPGERYRRIDKLRALVVIARSILTIIWHLLANPVARYHDLGAGLLRQPHQQRQQSPQPHPPARSPRLHRHRRPQCRRSLSPHPASRPGTGHPHPGFAAARPAEAVIFRSDRG
jgi:transposase